MIMTHGIVYIATGKKCTEEALGSAESVKKAMPGCPVVLFTEQIISTPHVDQIIAVERPYFSTMDKVFQIKKSPFERTLYLDSDTHVCADLSPLFRLLDRFDFAAAHAPRRHTYLVEGVPPSYPELNGGVLLFRKSEATQKLFSDWQIYYQEDLDRNMVDVCRRRGAQRPVLWQPDQPALCKALYLSDLRIATLTPEYNCRFGSLGSVKGEVKILHGRRVRDLDSVAREMNQSIGRRAFFSREGALHILTEGMNRTLPARPPLPRGALRMAREKYASIFGK